MAERCTDTLRTTLFLELLHSGTTIQMSVVQSSEKRSRVKSTQSQWKIPTPDTSILMNEADIISGVKNSTIFGMVLVDIDTPEELMADFQEMTPIFKNFMFSSNDMSEHMKKHLLTTDSLPQSQQPLIGIYFRENILLGSPMLQWYLQKGLVVNKFHLLVEYIPTKSEAR